MWDLCQTAIKWINNAILNKEAKFSRHFISTLFESFDYTERKEYRDQSVTTWFDEFRQWADKQMPPKKRIFITMYKWLGKHPVFKMNS